jgi:hypothetical protein
MTWWAWLIFGIALGIFLDGLIFDMPWSRRWRR